MRASAEVLLTQAEHVDSAQFARILLEGIYIYIYIYIIYIYIYIYAYMHMHMHIYILYYIIYKTVQFILCALKSLL